MKRLISILILATAFGTAAAADDYFQQRVNYNIKVELDPETGRLSGTEALCYFNNSPDTLHEIYFHLYYNAFQPASYLDRYEQKFGDYSIASTPDKDIGFVRMDFLKNDGFEIKNVTIDNTILGVPLLYPLWPGDSTYFYIEFTSQIPVEGYRAARGKGRFDVAQWYPKPAVYDKFGWHIEQHLGIGEFYGEYGDFDVEITLPDSFVVAHCGTLLNEEEVFGGKLPVPDGDSVIIDALRYTNRGSIPISGKSGKPKTWKIKAGNIHDFAFCADPNFIIDICKYNNTIIKSYYMPEVKRHWQGKAIEYTRSAIEFYSENYYHWPYKQYSTVNSEITSGGMEYPDLTMISGDYSAENPYDHELEETVAHEVGHAWFYGILGFNETAEAFLDEGLTSFVTIKYMENKYGRFGNNFAYTDRWQKKLLPNGDYRNDTQSNYIKKAQTGTEDPMTTPADMFYDWASYYNTSYDKAASVYFMLQQVMGNEKFRRFTRVLFERWAFKHPYFSDLQNLAGEISGENLQWFFNQWFRTTWTLDYAIEQVQVNDDSLSGRSGYSVGLLLKNKGRCVAPLDIAIYHHAAPADTIKIPVEVWQKGVSEFDTSVFLASPPSKVVIDPELVLADIDRLNNSTVIIEKFNNLQLPLPPITYQFVVPKFIYPQNVVKYPVDSYQIAHNPAFWYNAIDGAQLGYRIRGAYLKNIRKLDGAVSVGAQSGNIDYSFRYENPFSAFHPQTEFFFGSREWDGRGRQDAGLTYSSYDMEAPRTTLAKLSIERNYLFDNEYIYGNAITEDATETMGEIVTAEFSIARKFAQRFGQIDLLGNLSTSTFASDYDFNRIAAGINLSIPGVGIGQTDILFKLGRADGEVPYQRRFFLSSADPYDTWDSPLFRSRGTLPDKWKSEGHLFQPGGAGLSGYLSKGISGTRFFSARISNDLPAPKLPFEFTAVNEQMQEIYPQIYFAGGRAWDRGGESDDFLFESGFIISYKIPYLDLFISENRLSIYLPLWLSDPDEGDDNLKWRWGISITP